MVHRVLKWHIESDLLHRQKCIMLAACSACAGRNAAEPAYQKSDYIRVRYTIPTQFVLFFLLFTHICLPASGQAVVTGVVPFPRFSPSIFIPHRVQQSHCPSVFHRVLLTHALVLSSPQVNLCPRKSPNTNLYEYALGGIRTHETDLYQARG